MRLTNRMGIFALLSCMLAVMPLLALDLLGQLAAPQAGRGMRASSADPNLPGNGDARPLAAGQTITLANLAGPGQIQHIWFTVNAQDGNYPRAMVLRMYWDGESQPSVETPLGDFFAVGHGLRRVVDSIPVAVTSDGKGYNCYWRMPFRTNARIALTNEGAHELCVYWQFDWMAFREAPRDLRYFHARYRQEFPAKPFAPYTIFEGRGEGHYVGTVFSLQSSFGSWFGESDDRFYVDGEEEPSIVGTGTEDYFNDAWNLRLFTHPYVGVTIKEPNAEDCRFTAYRWHIPAPVTFTRALKVEIERRSYCEVIDPKTGARTQYDFKYRPDFCSSVAFWYQKEPAAPLWAFPPLSERINPEVFVEVTDLADRITASEGVRVAARSNRIANLKRFLKVENDRRGAWFEIPCTVPEAGKYSVSVFQCLSQSGGTWSVVLRGPAGEIVLDKAMDFYDPFLAVKEHQPENFLYGTWREKKVGIHALAAGKYAVRFLCVGSHPLSRASAEGALGAPGLDCGLDGISLRRFPWDDLAGWMERYLAQEAQLFAAREQAARDAVALIGERVARFRNEHGELPRDLGVLPEPPPRDPWGQQYRYDSPGRFNPTGFDIYSVHGNSRSPGLWIGNWTQPYVLAGAAEGESLEVAAAAEGVRAQAQELALRTIPPLSGGKLLFIRLEKEGDWIDLRLPRAAEKRTALSARLVTSRDYGVVRVALDGKECPEPFDGFSAAIDTRLVSLGTIEPGTQGAVLRIRAIGRNALSTGYMAGIDAIIATPVR